MSSIQQRIKEGIIKDIHHIKSEQQLGDTFTKKSVKSYKLIKAVSRETIEDFEEIEICGNP